MTEETKKAAAKSRADAKEFLLALADLMKKFNVEFGVERPSWSEDSFELKLNVNHMSLGTDTFRSWSEVDLGGFCDAERAVKKANAIVVDGTD